MNKTNIVNKIHQKYITLKPQLNERTRRLWAATEANAIGRGGILLVKQAINMDMKTIRRGLKEINDPIVPPIPSHRSRIQGGGQKK